MGIKLKEIHIENFRSIETMDVELNDYKSVFFGKNNAGKTNIFLAINAVLNNIGLDKSDIFRKKNESDDEIKNKELKISLRFIPLDNDNKETSEFSAEWSDEIAESVAIDSSQQSLIYELTYKYNNNEKKYVKNIYNLSSWKTKAKANKYNISILDVLNCYYINANRDLSRDLYDKNSIWNKEISKIKIDNDKKDRITKLLNETSYEVIQSSNNLTSVINSLKYALCSKDENIDLSIVPTNVDNLFKKVDISVVDDNKTINISNLGMGSKSESVFSTIDSLLKVKKELLKDDNRPFYVILLLEEPEAHLHPSGQKKIFKYLGDMIGQKLITTHSTNAFFKENIMSLYHVKNDNISTTCYHCDFANAEDIEKYDLPRYIFSINPQTLFGKINIFVEGLSDKIAIETYYYNYYGRYVFEDDVVVTDVGGHKYSPYIYALSKMNILWLIFSDGDVISDLFKDLNAILELSKEKDLFNDERILIIEDGRDFEGYLINNGYGEQITAAINSEDLENLDNFMKDNNGNKYKKNHKFGEKRCYSSEGGKLRAIEDFLDLSENKIPYARVIANEICKLGKDRYPEIVKRLFNKIDLFRGE